MFVTYRRGMTMTARSGRLSSVREVCLQRLGMKQSFGKVHISLTASVARWHSAAAVPGKVHIKCVLQRTMVLDMIILGSVRDPFHQEPRMRLANPCIPWAFDKALRHSRLVDFEARRQVLLDSIYNSSVGESQFVLQIPPRTQHTCQTLGNL